MSLRSQIEFIFIFLTIFQAISLLADTLWLKDGSILQGRIDSLSDGTLTLKTGHLGDLKVPSDQIVSFSSNEPIVARLSEGTILTGAVSGSPDQTPCFAIDDETREVPLDSINALWNTDGKDPAILAAEKLAEEQNPKWTIETGLGMTSKSGNTNQNNYRGSLHVERETPKNRIETHARFRFEESGSVGNPIKKTAEEIIGGVKYTKFFSEKWGWYVREELERDRFENIVLRSTSAAGFTWKAIKNEKRTLELSAGLSDRYEHYGFDLNKDGIKDRTGSDNLPGLDFGLDHTWKIAKWVEMTNQLTYSPSFDQDLGGFRVTHLSALDFPFVKTGTWKLRLSLENQFTSNVEKPAEKLDSAVALSLLYKWK